MSFSRKVPAIFENSVLGGRRGLGRLNQITYRPDDMTQLHELAIAAKQNGILRQDFDPAMFPILILNVTTATLQSFSRYKEVMSKLDSPEMKEHTMDQIAKFVMYGVMEPSLL